MAPSLERESTGRSRAPPTARGSDGRFFKNPFASDPTEEIRQTFATINDALATSAANLVRARPEATKRLALLYLLYEVDQARKDSGLYRGKHGLSELLGVEQARVDSWISTLIDDGLVVAARGALVVVRINRSASRKRGSTSSRETAR